MQRQIVWKLDQLYQTEAELLKDAKAFIHSQPDTMCIPVRDKYAIGYSDLILCVAGKFCAIELKDNTGKTTIHQELFLKDVRNAGGISGVARTLRDIDNLLQEARNGHQRGNSEQ